ncbi:type IV pilin protein [Candidatus Omnitrophota bacterium]
MKSKGFTPLEIREADRRSKKVERGLSLTGFTLVEVMIVVAIIALLAAIAIPNLLRARLNANEARAKASLHGLVTSVESYAAQEGLYPANESELTNLTPPYLNVPTCNQTTGGYTVNCSNMSTIGYTISAMPQVCNTTGTKTWTVTTGNIWVEAGC